MLISGSRTRSRSIFVAVHCFHQSARHRTRFRKTFSATTRLSGCPEHHQARLSANICSTNPVATTAQLSFGGLYHDRLRKLTSLITFALSVFQELFRATNRHWGPSQQLSQDTQIDHCPPDRYSLHRDKTQICLTTTNPHSDRLAFFKSGFRYSW